ncbi:unnamed protein product [Amoebophrya sp. A25]|nr:unnamed protein product [Amoebophrya sp. A25]|eukprot:GSA25T00025833001.1
MSSSGDKNKSGAPVKPCLDMRGLRGQNNMGRHERSNMNVVMTSFQERKYGVDGKGGKDEGGSRAKGERVKPYWRILEEKAEREKEQEARFAKRRRLEQEEKQQDYLDLVKNDTADDGAAERAEKKRNPFSKFNFSKPGCPGTGWQEHPDDPLCWWWPEKNVIWNEGSGLFHLCDETGIVCELDPFWSQGDAYLHQVKAEVCQDKTGDGIFEEGVKMTSADGDGAMLTKAVIVKDLLQACAAMKVGDMSHMNSPLSLYAAFTGPGADHCAKNFHMKLIKAIASYRGEWTHDRFQRALERISRDLHGELVKKGEQQSLQCTLVVAVVNGIRVHCLRAGKQARVYLDEKELVPERVELDAPELALDGQKHGNMITKGGGKGGAHLDDQLHGSTFEGGTTTGTSADQQSGNANARTVTTADDAPQEPGDTPLGGSLSVMGEELCREAPPVSTFSKLFDDFRSTLVLGISDQAFDFSKASAFSEEKLRPRLAAGELLTSGRTELSSEELLKQNGKTHSNAKDKRYIALVASTSFYSEEEELARRKREMNDGKIRCRHLLIKHKDVRNPNIVKDSKRVPVRVTRTKEEAEAIVRRLLRQLLDADKDVGKPEQQLEAKPDSQHAGDSTNTDANTRSTSAVAAVAPPGSSPPASSPPTSSPTVKPSASPPGGKPSSSCKLFPALIREWSECNSSRKGCDEAGDLGWFSRGRMTKLFEEAAFQLQVDEISDVVLSESGYHIIQRRG